MKILCIVCWRGCFVYFFLFLCIGKVHQSFFCK